MTQGDTSEGEDDEFIAVWPWGDPELRTSDQVDRVLVARSQVSWVEVEGHFLKLHTATGERYALRGTLTSLEQRWSKYGFVRIHNSFLVSLSHVRKLCPASRGGREAYLSFGADGRYLPISRRRFWKFKQMWISHIESQYEKSFLS